jgi:hypothetical protein
MGFSLLLAVLAIKFRKAAQKNADFRRFLMGHECSVVIKTKDNRRGKRFIFRQGAFSSDRALNEYDAAMIWKDAKTAFAGLRAGEDGIKRALGSHLVGIDGQLHSFTWFGAALKFVTT